MRALSVLAIVGLTFVLSACGDGSMETETPDAATRLCTGPLPQICQLCSDGVSRCAHFDENCNVVTCPTPTN
jgi:hypothetical protein